MAEPVTLPVDSVHIWAVSLTVGSAQLAEFTNLLSPDERQRAGRFLHAAAREQFTVTRATLRMLLGRYLRVDPREVRFVTANHGKPGLPGGDLFFNVSHTHGLALHAFTRRGEVGVDVEQTRHYPTHLDMAARFFSPGETAALQSLHPERSEEAFFHVWTRKEAFLKAVGLGLSHGLERFEVSVPPDDPARILHIDGDSAAGAAWSLQALMPAPGYVGTVAIPGPAPQVVLRHWSGEGF